MYSRSASDVNGVSKAVNTPAAMMGFRMPTNRVGVVWPYLSNVKVHLASLTTSLTSSRSSARARRRVQSFLEAHTCRVSDVLTEGQNLNISRRSIQTDGLRLTDPSLKPKRLVTKLQGFGLQRRQQLSGDTPPAPRRVGEHSLDFADAGFQFTHRSATDGFVGGACDQKHKPMISAVRWAKPVK